MSRQNATEVTEGQILAAIDMGSNSFHMAVGQFQGGEVRLMEKLGEKVRMAAGLDKSNNLTLEAFERGLDCLRRFAQRADNIDRRWLRCIGTDTLRKARNGHLFIAEAEQILGCPVEVVAGREEARLIYLGTAHSLPTSEEKRLVFDIGGGSTEFIIGERFDPLLTESLHLGCVTFAKKFFPDGEISEWNFFRAVMAARREVVAIEAAYSNLGWQRAIGCSGTIKAVNNALLESGQEGGIARDNLQPLIDKILSCHHVDEIDLPGVKPDRKAVFPSGLAILTGILEELKISSLEYCDGALREGILYDMLGRFRQDENVCERAVSSLMSRCGVDEEQATRVQLTALQAFDQVASLWKLDTEFRDLLRWAAMLHEVGLVISHASFHKHGAYLLEHSDLSGFTQQEQQLLAIMVLNHRRKMRLQAYADLPKSMRRAALKLTLLLRLAVALHRSRQDNWLPSFLLKAEKYRLEIQFPKGWLDEYPLTRDELEQEKEIWCKADFSLQIC